MFNLLNVVWDITVFCLLKFSTGNGILFEENICSRKTSLIYLWARQLNLLSDFYFPTVSVKNLWNTESS